MSMKLLIASEADSNKCIDLINGHPLIQVNINHENKTLLIVVNVVECKFYQVMKQRDSFRSWFVNNNVLEDGDLLIMTPVDVLYIILPFIMKKKNRFSSLRDILSDCDQLPIEIINCIEKNLSHDTLSVVADVKNFNEEIYIKFNHEKTLDWLKCKVNKVVSALRKNNITVSSSVHKAAGFTTGREDKEPDSNYIKYAYELVSDYLEEGISGELKKFLNIKDDAATNRSAEPKPIKRKFNEVEQVEVKPLEDYSKDNKLLIGKTFTEIKAAKMTRSQKELLKVDKTGMKSISSFFTPKRK